MRLKRSARQQIKKLGVVQLRSIDNRAVGNTRTRESIQTGRPMRAIIHGRLVYTCLPWQLSKMNQITQPRVPKQRTSKRFNFGGSLQTLRPCPSVSSRCDPDFNQSRSPVVVRTQIFYWPLFSLDVYGVMLQSSAHRFSTILLSRLLFDEASVLQMGSYF